MPGPKSYTGEDVLEINCHGGPAVVQMILERVLEQGARLAGPGEFTLRAFFNDRLDLSQAEAVAELVSAPTQVGVGLAGSKLAGGLSKRVKALKDDLESLQAGLSADFDFPEESGGGLDQEDMLRVIDRVGQDLHKLLQNHEQHACFQEGARVVLSGRVNVGKSRLLNTILGRSRAIVTDVPGTTRDYLEEAVNLEGLPVRLVDTAGLRQTQDEVEKAGLDHGRDLVSRADLVCLVLDLSRDPDREELDLALRLGPDKTLVAANKCDLVETRGLSLDWFESRGFDWVPVSARTGQGVDRLTQKVRSRLVGQGREPVQGELVPNIRQRDMLASARKSLEEFRAALKQSMSSDLLIVHLEEVSRALGEITGEITTEDVLERIFSSFCIGK
jgi:tRNA modification GTPase